MASGVKSVLIFVLPLIVIVSLASEPNVTFPIDTSPFTSKSLPITTFPFLSIVKTFPFCVAVPNANLISLVLDIGFKSILALEPNKTYVSLSIGFNALAFVSKLSAVCFFIELF